MDKEIVLIFLQIINYIAAVAIKIVYISVSET